jgi:hypothetical protein
MLSSSLSAGITIETLTLDQPTVLMCRGGSGPIIWLVGTRYIAVLLLVV